MARRKQTEDAQEAIRQSRAEREGRALRSNYDSEADEDDDLSDEEASDDEALGEAGDDAGEAILIESQLFELIGTSLLRDELRALVSKYLATRRMIPVGMAVCDIAHRLIGDLGDRSAHTTAAVATHGGQGQRIHASSSARRRLPSCTRAPVHGLAG